MSTNTVELEGQVGQSIKLQVSAMNEIGNSTYSVANTVKFAYRPSQPASLSLYAWAEPPVIQADWTAPIEKNGDEVNGYRVYVDDGNGNKFTQVYNGTSSSTL